VAPTSDEGLSLLEYAGTAQPGVYALTAMEKSESGDARRKWQERFSVSLQARESDLTRVSKDDAGPEGVLKDALGEIAFLYRKAGDELEGGAALTGDKGGREWMWLAVLGVAFLLFETLWSGVISKPEQ
jgi:hypothetical protein